MAFDVEIGQGEVPNSTGNESYSVSFQPKAVILFGVSKDGDGSRAESFQCIGMATSSTAAGVRNTWQDDAVTTTDCSESQFTPTDDQVFRDRRGGTENVVCQFVSFDSSPTGFTLNFSYIRAAYQGTDLFWIAFGGDDVTNAAVVTWQAPSSATTKDVDVGFTPDFVFLDHWVFVSDGNKPRIRHSLGAFTGSSNRWTMGEHADDNVSTSDCGRSQRTDNCVEFYDETGASVKIRADFSQWLSGATDGFQLNYTTTSSGAKAFALCLEGGQYDVGNADSATTTEGTGPLGYTGVGFQGKLGIFAGFCNASTTSRQDHSRFHFGAATSSTARSCIAWLSENGVTTTDASSDQDQTVCIKQMVEAGASPTTDAKADFSSWDSDGFTLDWETVDATARQFVYAIFGDADTGITATAEVVDAEYTAADATAQLEAVEATAEVVDGEYTLADATAALVEETATAEITTAEYSTPDATAARDETTATADVTTASYSVDDASASIGTQATVVVVDAAYTAPDATAALDATEATAGEVDGDYVVGDATAAVEATEATADTVTSQYLVQQPTAIVGITGIAVVVDAEYTAADPSAALIEITATAEVTDAEYTTPDPTAALVAVEGTLEVVLSDYVLGSPTASTPSGVEATANLVTGEYSLDSPIATVGITGIAVVVEAAYSANNPSAALVPVTATATGFSAEYKLDAPSAERTPVSDANAVVVPAYYVILSPTVETGIQGTCDIVNAEYLAGAPVAESGAQASANAVTGDYVVLSPTAAPTLEDATALGVTAEYTLADASAVPGLVVTAVGIEGEYVLGAPTAIPPFVEDVERIWIVPSGREGSWVIPGGR